jgi:hypothetical protein
MRTLSHHERGINFFCLLKKQFSAQQARRSSREKRDEQPEKNGKEKYKDRFRDFKVTEY